MKTGVEVIADERRRQIEKEGYTAEHDCNYVGGELATAAACYAASAAGIEGICNQRYSEMELFPWDQEHDKRKKHSLLKQLTIAGALIAAEIDFQFRMAEADYLLQCDQRRAAGVDALTRRQYADENNLPDSWAGEHAERITG